MRDDEYNCKRCSQVWTYIPDDYEEGKSPETCCFCNMSVWQLVKDTFKIGGIRDTIYFLWKCKIKPFI